MNAVIDGYLPPLLPIGDYQMVYQGHETGMLFGRKPKLMVHLKIVEPGEAFESTVTRYYNITRVIGRLGRHGRFKVAPHGDFLFEYVQLFGTAVRRLDRIPMSAFENKILLGRVATVLSNRNQRQLPEPLRYSVVRELLKVVQQ